MESTWKYVYCLVSLLWNMRAKPFGSTKTRWRGHSGYNRDGKRSLRLSYFRTCPKAGIFFPPEKQVANLSNVLIYSLFMQKISDDRSCWPSTLVESPKLDGYVPFFFLHGRGSSSSIFIVFVKIRYFGHDL